MDRRTEHLCFAYSPLLSRMISEQTEISFRTERASRKVYLLAGSEDRWEAATKHVPVWDGSPARAMALEMVARNLERGEEPGEAAKWWRSGSQTMIGAGIIRGLIPIAAAEEVISHINQLGESGAAPTT